MPDKVESEIFNVLKGAALIGRQDEEYDSVICDFTLEDQNAALETQGITPRVDPNQLPVIGHNITYIVAAVLINEQDEVLMIQEAKEGCAGKWYLPAGRLEKGESICQATEREVLEETGLKVRCKSLLMMESGKGMWFRFSVVGDVIGGSLKTPAYADKESIQAKWVQDVAAMTLRARDILPLIDRAREYKHAREAEDASWHMDILPVLQAHVRNYLRLVVAIRKKANNKVYVLLSEKSAWHLPTCEIHMAKSLHSTLRRFMIEIFGADVATHRPHGILTVEFDPKEDKAGFCLTILVAFKAFLEEVPILGKYVWHEASKELGDALMVRVASRNSTFPLKVVS